MSMQSVILFLILLISCLEVNSQVPTVPTAAPTTVLPTTMPSAPTITHPTTIPTPPTIISTTTTPIISTTTTPIVSVTTTTSSSSLFTCPPDGIGHYPVSNCQEFIVCVYGRQHMGRCADGTLFDPPSSSCMNANVVDCGSRYRP